MYNALVHILRGTPSCIKASATELGIIWNNLAISHPSLLLDKACQGCHQLRSLEALSFEWSLIATIPIFYLLTIISISTDPRGGGQPPKSWMSFLRLWKSLGQYRRALTAGLNSIIIGRCYNYKVKAHVTY